jgi:hypothetical protein
MPASSLACRLHRRSTQAVVGRDHLMHRRFGDPAVPRNLLCEA